MEDVDVCSNWEEFEEDSTILDKQLEKLKLVTTKSEQLEEGQRIKILSRQGQEVQGDNDTRVQLDSTLEESLRSQYVPPEPKISILMRPKASSSLNTHVNGHNNKNKPVKTLQQREQEYAEARMRILGDVKFEDSDGELEVEVEEVSAYAGLTPAEILKQKIAKVLLEDGNNSAPVSVSAVNSNTATTNPPATGSPSAPLTSRNGKNRNREKIKTSNPEPTRDFPVSKTDSERIIRQPRGPDGTPGFNFQLKNS